MSDPKSVCQCVLCDVGAACAYSSIWWDFWPAFCTQGFAAIAMQHYNSIFYTVSYHCCNLGIVVADNRLMFNLVKQIILDFVGFLVGIVNFLSMSLLTSGIVCVSNQWFSNFSQVHFTKVPPGQGQIRTKPV